jgi:RNA recognition motif-containing protein
MLHAILVDGMIERLEGSPQFADSEIERRRVDGHSSAYLFAARNDKEFERKRKVRPLVPRSSASDQWKETVNNILVGNLMPNVTEQEIRSVFEKYGTVRRFKIMTDRWTGLSRQFGFVQMMTDAAAEAAIIALNGADLNGKALKVNPARLQVHRKIRSKASSEDESSAPRQAN